jgi:hypothetical protein
VYKLELRELKPLPEDHILTPYKRRSSMGVVWDAAVSYIHFHSHAVSSVYHRSKWRGLMKAMHTTTKVVWAIFISAGGIGVLALFINYVWPLLGKRWWAIVFLSLFSVAVLFLNGIVKQYHQNETRDHEEQRKKLTDQITEDSKTISFEQDQKETARQLVDDLRSENLSLKAELATWNTHKLVFEVDQSKSRVSSANGLLRLTIFIRFENRDTHRWSLKGLDFTLHHQVTGTETKDLFTMITVRYALNGIEIPKQEFERMLIQDGVVTDSYEVTVDMHILSKDYKGFDSLSYDHFVRITMDASNQPPLTEDYIFASLNREQNHGTLFNLKNPDVHWARKIRHLNR